MNDTPSTDEQRDDLEELYRRTSTHFPRGPGAKTRQAILEHSARVATIHSHRTGTGQSIQSGTSSATDRNWRRPVLLGTLAAAALACVLIGPQFLHLSAPPMAPLGSPTKAISASKLTKPTAPSESAAAAASESARTTMSLPTTVVAPHIHARAMQVAAPAPAAAAANTDQAPSATSDSAAIAGVSAAASASGTELTVTGMRVRQRASAPESAPEATATIDARDSDGRTGLMSAVLQGRLDAVVALLRRGADPNAADGAGVTPLQAARAENRPEIVDALQQAGAR